MNNIIYNYDVPDYVKDFEKLIPDDYPIDPSLDNVSILSDVDKQILSFYLDIRSNGYPSWNYLVSNQSGVAYTGDFNYNYNKNYQLWSTMGGQFTNDQYISIDIAKKLLSSNKWVSYYYLLKYFRLTKISAVNNSSSFIPLTFFDTPVEFTVLIEGMPNSTEMGVGLNYVKSNINITNASSYCTSISVADSTLHQAYVGGQIYDLSVYDNLTNFYTVDRETGVIGPTANKTINYIYPLPITASSNVPMNIVASQGIKLYLPVLKDLSFLSGYKVEFLTDDININDAWIVAPLNIVNGAYAPRFSFMGDWNNSKLTVAVPLLSNVDQWGNFVKQNVSFVEKSVGDLTQYVRLSKFYNSDNVPVYRLYGDLSIDNVKNNTTLYTFSGQTYNPLNNKGSLDGITDISFMSGLNSLIPVASKISLLASEFTGEYNIHTYFNADGTPSDGGYSLGNNFINTTFYNSMSIGDDGRIVSTYICPNYTGPIKENNNVDVIYYDNPYTDSYQPKASILSASYVGWSSSIIPSLSVKLDDGTVICSNDIDLSLLKTKNMYTRHPFDDKVDYCVYQLTSIIDGDLFMDSLIERGIEFTANTSLDNVYIGEEDAKNIYFLKTYTDYFTNYSRNVTEFLDCIFDPYKYAKAHSNTTLVTTYNCLTSGSVTQSFGWTYPLPTDDDDLIDISGPTAYESFDDYYSNSPYINSIASSNYMSNISDNNSDLQSYTPLTIQSIFGDKYEDVIVNFETNLFNVLTNMSSYGGVMPDQLPQDIINSDDYVIWKQWIMSNVMSSGNDSIESVLYIYSLLSNSQAGDLNSLYELYLSSLMYNSINNNSEDYNDIDSNNDVISIDSFKSYISTLVNEMSVHCGYDIGAFASLLDAYNETSCLSSTIVPLFTDSYQNIVNALNDGDISQANQLITSLTQSVLDQSDQLSQSYNDLLNSYNSSDAIDISRNYNIKLFGKVISKVCGISSAVIRSTANDPQLALQALAKYMSSRVNSIYFERVPIILNSLVTDYTKLFDNILNGLSNIISEFLNIIGNCLSSILSKLALISAMSDNIIKQMQMDQVLISKVYTPLSTIPTYLPSDIQDVNSPDALLSITSVPNDVVRITQLFFSLDPDNMPVIFEEALSDSSLWALFDSSGKYPLLLNVPNVNGNQLTYVLPNFVSSTDYNNVDIAGNMLQTFYRQVTGDTTSYNPWPKVSSDQIAAATAATIFSTILSGIIGFFSTKGPTWSKFLAGGIGSALTLGTNLYGIISTTNTQNSGQSIFDVIGNVQAMYKPFISKDNISQFSLILYNSMDDLIASVQQPSDFKKQMYTLKNTLGILGGVAFVGLAGLIGKSISNAITTRINYWTYKRQLRIEEPNMNNWQLKETAAYDTGVSEKILFGESTIAKVSPYLAGVIGGLTSELSTLSFSALKGIYNDLFPDNTVDPSNGSNPNYISDATDALQSLFLPYLITINKKLS